MKITKQEKILKQRSKALEKLMFLRDICLSAQREDFRQTKRLTEIYIHRGTLNNL